MAESVGRSPKLWNTKPIPVRRSAICSSNESSRIGRSFHRTSPASGASSPDSTPRNVVLPEPDGPISATKSFAASEIEAPRTAWTPLAPR